MTMMMSREMVKVGREKLAACMTCPVCNKLLRDATTISECLHTFCRKCIYEKITEEELDTCPVCNIDLGCAPLEKLRADHNLQDLRCKIFPSQRHKAKAAEAMSLMPLPARRKERSMSSLVITPAKASAKSALTGKRSKPGPKKNPTLRESTIPIEESVKQVEDRVENLSSPETLSKIAQTRRQISCTAEKSKQHMPDKSREDNAEPLEGKADLWKPLNCLVEAASKTKSNKLNSQETVAKPAPLDAHDNEAHVPKPKVKEFGNEPKVHGNENDCTPAPSGSAKPRRSQGVRQKRAAGSEGLNIPAQTVVNANSKFDGRYGPIWFSLVASEDQVGDVPLPQISSCYLRVKDGSLPVAFIKKYLVKKLDLTSETEVEISLSGQPVLSTLRLHSLVDWWVQTAPASERIQTSVGRSAKEFVMVLSYGRKAQPP